MSSPSAQHGAGTKYVLRKCSAWGGFGSPKSNHPPRAALEEQLSGLTLHFPSCSCRNGPAAPLRSFNARVPSSPRQAGLSSASINSPRLSKEPSESRCLQTARVTRRWVARASRLAASQSGVFRQQQQWARRGLRAASSPQPQPPEAMSCRCWAGTLPYQGHRDKQGSRCRLSSSAS